jgi:hypothetical protein
VAYPQSELIISDKDLNSLKGFIGNKNRPGVYLDIHDTKTLCNALIQAPKTIIGTNEQGLLIVKTNIGSYNKEHVIVQEIKQEILNNTISDMDMITLDNTSPIFPKFTINIPLQISDETIILCTKSMEYVTLILGTYAPHNTYYNFKEENRKVIKLPISTILKAKNVHRISLQPPSEQETI